jgi:hypothetical protein
LEVGFSLQPATLSIGESGSDKKEGSIDSGGRRTFEEKAEAEFLLQAKKGEGLGHLHQNVFNSR